MDNLLKETETALRESQLEKIDKLKAEWMSVQPLGSSNEQRLKQKLRLEWNYNSNQIEGNTLTYGETELLLIQGQTVGTHTIREYEEMKAHDVAVEYVGQLAEDERSIGETDIRDLNKIILKEPFWKEAQTIDGKPTRKYVVPGEYKTLPNNVRTPTGEIFEFAKPEDTPSRMLDLINWLRGEFANPTQHVLQTASKLHHEFVLIHPFDDGNGRVARLLTNYVLLRFGLPPLIVKSADKPNYLATLRLADVGRLEAFTEYLGRQLEWSLQLGLRAAKGETLEEPSDLEKEIAIFIREQQANRNEIKKRSPEVLEELYSLGLEKLFSRFEEKILKLSPLFAETNIHVTPAPKQFQDNWRMAFEHFATRNTNQPSFVIRIQLRGYKSADVPFNIDAALQLHFEEFRYAVNTGSPRAVSKLYSEPILSDEADQITSQILRTVFEKIKSQTRGKKR